MRSGSSSFVVSSFLTSRLLEWLAPREPKGSLAGLPPATTEEAPVPPRIIGEKIRSFLVRGLAVITVVLTYALGNEGTQVLRVAVTANTRLCLASLPSSANSCHGLHHCEN